MKTLLHCALVVLLLLTATHCATLNSSAVGLSSKRDESFQPTIKSVYLEVKGELFGEDEKMYLTIIKSLQTSLRQKGVVLQEDFTGNASPVTPDSTDADVWLILGRPFQDVGHLAIPIPIPGGGFAQPTIHRQRFIIRLVDPATSRDVWVGEVTCLRGDAPHVGSRVVRDWTAAGLLAPTTPD